MTGRSSDPDQNARTSQVSAPLLGARAVDAWARTRQALVDVREAQRTYGRGPASIVAVASATCTIVPRDRIAVVGPSGSGKSTLLHLMGGLDTPTSGIISWPALGPRETLRPVKVAFVFQMPSLLAPLSVLENVELPLLLDHVNPDLARAAARDALERIELLEIADRLPEELSGGQAQRVVVARALASRPLLILADEPTGQLDHPTAQRLFDVWLATLEGTSTALVVATHDPVVAERMETVWHMRHGTLEVSR
jgi:ABC-type lipoprotein export system ATPase subunit